MNQYLTLLTEVLKTHIKNTRTAEDNYNETISEFIGNLNYYFHENYEITYEFIYDSKVIFELNYHPDWNEV